MADRWRLFFGLWPDDATRNALAGVTRGDNLGGRAVPAENLHVTLAFVGATEPQRVGVLTRIAADMRAAPFVLTFDRREVWGRGLEVLVPNSTPEPLMQLVHDLNSRLRQAEFPTEARPYRAHVTLARAWRRGRERDDSSTCTESRSTVPIAISWIVEDFVLVRSQASADRSRYEVLQRWPLRP